MPLITSSTDSLPYIDRPPSPSSLASAATLISSATPPQSNSRPLHPSLPPVPETNFTPLIQTELDRLARGEPFISPTRTGIDAERYAALPTFPPSTTTSPSSESNISAQRASIRHSSTNVTYLRHRALHLQLLDQYGKNAWLLGNDALESLLKAQEQRLVHLRAETEEVNRARKAGQEGGRGEVEGLEADWRGGVGRVVEVEVALAEGEGGR